jgi:DNA-binding HxlR family transcriptional regulator
MAKPERRSYNQYCALAHSLDVVGERWTLLIVRDLMLGPRRYTDLLRGLPGITTNLLAKRLQEMEAAGLVEPVRAPGTTAGSLYRLTERGAALEPALQLLAGWGMRLLQSPKSGEYRSIEFALLSLRRRYLGGAAMRVELVADDEPYRMTLTKSSAEIARGEMPSPDLRVRGPALAIAKMFFDPKRRAQLPAGVSIEGSTDRLPKLLGAFAVEELPLTPTRP